MAVITTVATSFWTLLWMVVVNRCLSHSQTSVTDHFSAVHHGPLVVDTMHQGARTTRTAGRTDIANL